MLGRDVLSARRRVGYLAGDFELYEQLTGAAVLAYFARLRGDVPHDRIGELASASAPTSIARCASSRPATARRSG